MTENPKDWRSAVDPNSGKTYWYHRDTRVSTWVRPNFQEEDENIGGPLVPVVNKSVPVHTQPTNRREEFPIDSDPPRSSQKIAESSHALHFSISPNDKINEQRLSDLYRSIDAASPDELSDNASLVFEVVNAVINISSRSCRQLSLRCLFRLSFSRIISSTAFQLNQTWNNIWRYASKWDDYESHLLLAGVICNLSIGSTVAIVSQESLELLCSKLNDLFPSNNLQDLKLTKSLALDVVDFLLNEYSMDWFIALAQRGHDLASLVLIVVATYAMK